MPALSPAIQALIDAAIAHGDLSYDTRGSARHMRTLGVLECAAFAVAAERRPPAPRRADHAVFDCATNDLVCRHCGRRERVELPIDVQVIADLGRAFADKHRMCPPSIKPAEGAP